MNVQIEVTTRCNYDCFYCAGRDMEQRDMPFDAYLAVMDNHVARHGLPRQVSLQGEGEPTLNKAFFEMAAHARSIGAEPYTITNGTYRYPEHFRESFRAIGVSIDSLDPGEAERIGRYNLERVLEFVDAASKFVEVIVHTVALSPSSFAVTEWCRKRGLRQIVQPLQAKDDYRQRYPGRVVLLHRPKLFQCGYLSKDIMRYYAVDGSEFPCCFIKDANSYRSIDDLRATLARGTVPPSCAGCSNLC